MTKTFALTLGLIVVATAAQPSDAATVAVFDHPGFVDTLSGGNSAESDNIQASLELLGHSVEPFIATDAANIAAALSGADVFVIPELENGNLAPELDALARSVITDFVAGGGGLIISATSGQRAPAFLNDLFGFNLVSGASGDGERTRDALGTAFAHAPVLLPSVSRTRALDIESLPGLSLAVYVNDVRASVARMSHGGGRVVYLGWDWFNAVPTGTTDSGWLGVLDAAVADVVACSDPNAEDLDLDGVPDVCDAVVALCTDVDGERELAIAPKVVVKRINKDTIPGNDGLNVAGELHLPAGSTFGDLNPQARPVAVVVEAGDGAMRISETISVRAYGGPGTMGWRLSRKGKRWRFLDETGAPQNGIVEAVLKDRRHKTPGQVRVRIVGKNGSYPIVLGDAPLTGVVIVGDPVAGECARTDFTADDCTLGRRLKKLSCKRP